MLWSPCWLPRVTGNVLSFDVKEDERNDSLLDGCPVWCCVIWYIMFSEKDHDGRMMEVHIQNKSKYSKNKTEGVYKMKSCQFK